MFSEFWCLGRWRKAKGKGCFSAVKYKICSQIWCVWQIKRNHKRITKDDTLACLLRVCTATVYFPLVYSPLIYMKRELCLQHSAPNFLLWRQLPYLPFSKLKVKIASLSGAAAAAERLAKVRHLTAVERSTSKGSLLPFNSSKESLKKWELSFTSFTFPLHCSLTTYVYSTVPHFMRAHGLWPNRLLCPWDFPGKNTTVGCHFLLQGSNPVSTVSCTAGGTAEPPW